VKGSLAGQSGSSDLILHKGGRSVRSQVDG
jgi:hypothetical protein